jgi:hypothetical protein
MYHAVWITYPDGAPHGAPKY